MAEQVLKVFPTCSIPEVERLDKTLTSRRTAFLGLLGHRPREQRTRQSTQRPDRVHRRIARGIPNPDRYRLLMLLIGGGLSQPHLIWEEPAILGPALRREAWHAPNYERSRLCTLYATGISQPRWLAIRKPA